MFILFCTAILFVLLVAAGGHLSRLGALRLRQTWLLFSALALQLLITEAMPSSAPGWLDACLHVLSYVLAGVFLWRNRLVPGLVLLGTGAAANGVVIALNGGELPASARALRAAHIHQAPGAFANSGRLAHPVLPWLGDIVASPSWLPFQNVLSIGDVLILAGAAWLLVGTCGTRWTAPAAAGALPGVTPDAEAGADVGAGAGVEADVEAGLAPAVVSDESSAKVALSYSSASTHSRGRHRAGGGRSSAGVATVAVSLHAHAAVEGESCAAAPAAARGVLGEGSGPALVEAGAVAVASTSGSGIVGPVRTAADAPSATPVGTTNSTSLVPAISARISMPAGAAMPMSVIAPVTDPGESTAEIVAARSPFEMVYLPQ